MDRTVKKEHHLRLSQLCSRRPGLLRLIGFYRGFTRAFLLLLCGIGTLAMLFGGLYAVLQSGDADTQITGQALPQLQKEHSAYFSGTMIGQSLWLGSVHPNTFLLLRGNSTLQAPQADMGNVPMKQLIDETTLTDDDIYAFDRSAIPAGEHAVVPMNLSGHATAGEVLFSNTTSFTIDSETYKTSSYPINTQAPPAILILHTHATESFLSANAVSYNADTVKTRTQDTAQNVVAVGDILAQTFTECGLQVFHCRELFDAESYPKAYENAAAAIRRYLKEYPQIGYVFDVHRDALCRQNGDEIKPVTAIDGVRCAQVMLVVGTDEAGANHPDWEKNLTVAVHIQQYLTQQYTDFARPINIRSATFNEQYTAGSLLLEIGSFGNTLEEAKRAARHLGYAMADIITGNTKNATQSA